MSVRAKAFGWIEKAPGRVGALARRANEALGRPLASDAELADREAFARGYVQPTAAPQTQQPQAAAAPAPRHTPR